MAPGDPRTGYQRTVFEGGEAEKRIGFIRDLVDDDVDELLRDVHKDGDGGLWKLEGVVEQREVGDDDDLSQIITLGSL